MYDMPAIIFAGGKSSRMGEDKALLPFGGYSSLSQFQYSKLKKYFHTVYLSSKEDKFEFKCDLILDSYDKASPLVGLLSVFERLDCDEIFVFSVDAPLVDQHIIQSMFDANEKDYDAIIAESPKGLQPLCGMYSRTIVPLLRTAYENNDHKLMKLLRATKMKAVLFDNEEPFTNLNYKDEYEKLLLR